MRRDSTLGSAKVLPVDDEGVLSGEERDPVPGVDYGFPGHGPVVDHDELHETLRDVETLQDLGQGGVGSLKLRLMATTGPPWQ